MSGITKICGTHGKPFSSVEKRGEHLLGVGIVDPLTTFGTVPVSEEIPDVQIDAIYGLRNTDVETFNGADLGLSGTVSADMVTAGSMFCVGTGTNAFGYGVIRSLRTNRYRPGVGSVFKVSAIFNDPTTSSLQFAGAFNIGNDLGFGYNNADFGIFSKSAGRPEIQYLEVSTATGSQTFTITLDGTAYTVSTTASDPTLTASQIAGSAQFANSWNTQAFDSRVVFDKRSVGVNAGAFSVTTTGTFSGTLTQKTAGQAKIETFVTQASWNADDLLVDTSSSFVLDPQKGNVYKIEYSYLGFANYNFFIQNPKNGEFKHVHQQEYANANTQPSMDIPYFKTGWFVANQGNTSNLQIKGGSAESAAEGVTGTFRNSRGYTASKNVDTSFQSVLTICGRTEFNGRTNLARVQPLVVDVAVDGTKPAEVEIILNGSFATGTAAFFYEDETESVIGVDTTGNTITGGKIVFGGSVAKAGSLNIDLSKLNIVLTRTEALTVAVRATSGTTDASVGLTWLED
jgi:hypothetical protein